MSTTTTTIAAAQTRRSSSSSSKRAISVKTTLRTLYDQAKHAFLQRNLALADKLVAQAFTQLGPPISYAHMLSSNGSNAANTTGDALDSQRRKWDILRITLQTTVYTSQASKSDIPPYQFLQRLHSQSLKLFTPVDASPSIANVPDQVLLLLVVSSLKLDEVRVGKEWVEEWLVSRRPSTDPESTETTDGMVPMTSYERVVDVYLLYILPRLGLWDDAHEFLKYEAEMKPEVKERITHALHVQQKAQESATSNNSRASSPSPSLASSTSTVSAMSRASPPRPASAASISSSASTATVRPSHRQLPQTNGVPIKMTNVLDSKGKGRANGYLEDAEVGGHPPLDTPSSQQNGSRIMPLPKPPLTSDRPSSPSLSSSSTHGDRMSTSHSGRSFIPIHMQQIFAYYYLHLAEMLNHQFGLSLSTNLSSHQPGLKPGSVSLWHVVTVIVPVALTLHIFSRIWRVRPTNRISGAGDIARRRLRGQSSAVGTKLGLDFWKVAMRAVTDAVNMGSRGLV